MDFCCDCLTKWCRVKGGLWDGSDRPSRDEGDAGCDRVGSNEEDPCKEATRSEAVQRTWMIVVRGAEVVSRPISIRNHTVEPKASYQLLGP